MTRPAPAVGERMARQRQRRLEATPLLDVVRAFLAEGVPMHGGLFLGLSCAYCGVGASVLAVDGHAPTCAWARLRDRVAGE